MKPGLKLAAVFLLLMANACDQISGERTPPVTTEVLEMMEQVQTWLPGAYSNYAQILEDDTGQSVTDLDIRQLTISGDTVFLFESFKRDSDSTNYEIYWLKTNIKTQTAEFHFSYLSESELSLPMNEVLEIAWQRVKPGCALVVNMTAGQLRGQTNPETCLFEHLLQGETHLQRSLTLSSNTLSIINHLIAPGESAATDKGLLRFQKHRVFVGWASTRTEAGPDQEQAGEWKLSSFFSIRDDGRVNNIRDQEMNSIGFGLQLARLNWIEGQPPYNLLKVINMKNGDVQAYSWFEPDLDTLELNLNWFQSSLELKPDEPAQAPN